MKKEKRLCRVARSHPLTDFTAIEDDLLVFEKHEDQKLLLRKMDKMRRMKSYLHFLLFSFVLLFGVVASGLR